MLGGMEKVCDTTHVDAYAAPDWLYEEALPSKI